MKVVFFFFSSRRRHTRCSRDWSSDVCSSDLIKGVHVDMNDLANGQGVQCPGVSKALISFRNSDEFMKTAKCPPLIVANLLCGASMPSTKALPMPAGVTKSSVPWRIPVCARNLITREEQMRRAPHAGWPFFVHQ